MATSAKKHPKVPVKLALLGGCEGIRLETTPKGLRLPQFTLRERGPGVAEIARNLGDQCGEKVIGMGRTKRGIFVYEGIPQRKSSCRCSCSCAQPRSPRIVFAEIEREGYLTDEARLDVEDVTQYLEGASGSFSKPGWFLELIEWGQSLGIPLTENFTQYKSGAKDQLIYFDTSCGGTWFKTSAGSLRREFSITPVLAKENPDMIPEVLGMKPEWCGWLQRHIPGPSLLRVDGTEAWEQVVKALATLQIRYLGQHDRLLSLGAKDRRLRSLRTRVTPFFQGMATSMERQTSNRAVRLKGVDLQWLAARAADLLEEAESWPVAVTLTHGDFSPTNIICGARGPQFLDWAEASVGLPFETMHYLLAHRRKYIGEEKSGEEVHLWQLYAAEWSGIVPPSTLERAWHIGRALTALTVLLVSAFEQVFVDRDCQRAAYLRSVTRQLNLALSPSREDEVCA